MKSKTWKIGEYCAGGIIRAKCGNESVKIEVIDSNTREVIAVNTFGRVHLGYTLEAWMSEFTTPYYTGIVLEWVRGNLS